MSAWLADLLAERGENIVLMQEGDERIPCDFCFTAGIPKNIFETLCDEHNFNKGVLYKIALTTENYVYIRIDKCDENVAEIIKKYDMGEETNQFISVADYAACFIERLKHWVDSHIGNDDIVVMENGYLQGPINEMFFRGASDDEVRNFIGDITKHMLPLNPICIYLRRESADAAINFAKKAKGKEWAEAIENMLKQKEWENFFGRRFDLEHEMLKNIEHLDCFVDGYNWDDAKEKIILCGLC